MKTQISLVLLGLGLASGAAFADHMAEPMPVSNDINVTAPYQTGMWSFGATAVLMQPTNSAFTYGTVFEASDETASGTDLDYQNVDQDYKWWFGADVTYHFPGNGRDVTLAYEGLHGDNENHADVDVDDPSVRSNFSEEFYTSAEGEHDVSYDAGDLVFGQKLDVGERIRLHPFMGIRYAHVDQEDTGKFFGGEDSDDNPTTEVGDIETEFNGIGPRFGSDAQINLGSGFSIRGRLGLSVLIGSSSVTYEDTVTSFDAVTGDIVDTDGFENERDSTTQLVPEIDGRLGLNYTYNFDSNMALGVELGWQATNYFNVIADQSIADFVGNHYQDSSNFGVQGPYARIQLDVA